MIIELPSGKYRIYFRHVNNGSGMWNYSECVVRDANNEVVAWGQAKCSPNDQFRFDTGRRISLERALSTGVIDHDFSRQERGLIWRQYFEEHKDLERRDVRLVAKARQS